MTTLADLVRRQAAPAEIGAHLDELSGQLRVQQCLSLPGKLMPDLFERARGYRALDVDSFVTPMERTVVYELKNNLPAFNVSQKRFYRPARGQVVGYNHTGALSILTGPGYFYAVNGDDGELVFDYTRLPDFRPPGWPPLRHNTGLIARATYGDMIDYVRGVSMHTAIGAAFRGGRPRNAYFLLTRSAAES